MKIAKLKTNLPTTPSSTTSYLGKTCNPRINLTEFVYQRKMEKK